MQYRSLTSAIRAAFSGPLASKLHFTPYKMFHKSAATGKNERVYSEIYDSDVLLQEHDRVQRLSPPPEDPSCKRERIVAAIMCWSDMTHLTNFGSATLWPIYMMLGNLSKYVRANPNSGACMHLAYLPSLPDSFQEFASTFHRKWRTQKDDIRRHCKKELAHAAWTFLLDKDFLHAYRYGMVVKCSDGIERRIYPRFLTYSADYPEKALLATIKDGGTCPCPRCLVPGSKLDLMGQVRDLTFRLTGVRKYLRAAVKTAREIIYNMGLSITTNLVKKLLSETSSVPTVNAFDACLGSEPGFNLHRMLVVDLLHEFELGIWKALFIHLVRMLYAADRRGSLVEELDNRFRRIPTFGSNGTIRKFSTNVSAMKKLAGRDFEDILQCAIPAFEGLLDEPHNARLMKLLFRTAEWHALAKLRLHTESTLAHFEQLTTEYGQLMRQFRDFTCSQFQTVELPREVDKRRRKKGRKESKGGNSNSEPVTAEAKELNISTYKFHALGDYVQTIKDFGGTDSYSTQVGELAHRTVKRLYRMTNKRNHSRQIALRYRRQQASLESRFLRNSKKSTSSLQPKERRDPDLPYQISWSQNQPVNIWDLLRTETGNLAYNDFWRKLQGHLLGRLIGANGDLYGTFSDEERNTVHVVRDQIYAVNAVVVNFTTYDIRRDFDYVHSRTHPDVVAVPQEGGPHHGSYRYARVLGVYHAKVWSDHPQCASHAVQQIQFLWVRWFRPVKQGRFTAGFRSARLPKVAMVPPTDYYAFTFLDPAALVRGCHLIPAFASQPQTASETISNSADPRAVALNCQQDGDTVQFYVNIFVDRDMFMRYIGIEGVGHLGSNRDLLASDQSESDFENDDDEMDSDRGEGSSSRVEENRARASPEADSDVIAALADSDVTMQDLDLVQKPTGRGQVPPGSDNLSDLEEVSEAESEGSDRLSGLGEASASDLGDSDDDSDGGRTDDMDSGDEADGYGTP